MKHLQWTIFTDEIYIYSCNGPQIIVNKYFGLYYLINITHLIELYKMLFTRVVSIACALLFSGAVAAKTAAVVADQELAQVQHALVKRKAKIITGDEKEKNGNEHSKIDLRVRDTPTTYTITDIVTVTSATDIIVSFAAPASLCNTANLAYHSS